MPAEKNGSETTVERKSDRELVVTRTFNGPATIVFDAWTKPELVMRWWAPRAFGMKLVSCEIDLRVGGKYRYVFNRDGDTTPLVFCGKYTLVERPTRLAWTDEDNEGTDGKISEPAGDAMSSLTLAEKNGKTTLTLLSRFASKEALEAMAAGMEAGTRATLDQLEELLAALSA